MAINERLIDTEVAAAGGNGGAGSGNQEEGLILHLDANDVDSYDGDGSYWVDIANHEYKPATNPSEHFNTVTYAGTSSTNSITGVGFQPDLVWLKQRNSAQNHGLFDSVRGANNFIMSNATDGANTRTTDTLSSFDSDGFTLTGYTSDAFINYTGRTMVGWCFKAGGAPSGSDKVSIDGTSYSTMAAAGLTDGTEPISKLSVNTKLGFSIVQYTAPALTGDTVAHGLGETPEMIILKSTSAARNWNVFHKDVGTSKNMHLNTNDDADTDEYWTANSTTFSIQDYSSSADWIAYCFTSKRGVSKVGSYAGGAAGNKIYTGFEPAFVMVKRTNGTGSWEMFDNKRGKTKKVWANETLAEVTNTSPSYIEFNRDGFSHPITSTGANSSGNTYLYLAFAKDTNETSLIPGTDLELHLDAVSFPQKGESGYSNTPTTWTALTGNNGIITNATFDSELGNYLDLDGSGDYINVPSTGLLDGDFTIEMWWNFDTVNPSGSGYRMLWGGSGYSSGTGLGHYIEDNKIRTWVSVSGTTTNVLTSSGILSANTWHHIVLKREGGTWTSYLDGEQATTGSGTTTSLASSNSRIGAHYNTATSHDVDGKVGQVRIYDSALSQDQIRQNFNFTKNDYPNGFNAVNSSYPASFNADYFDFTRGSIASGSDQMVVDSSIHSLLNNLNEYTFTAWYYPDNLSGRNVIFGTGHTSSNNVWILFRLKDNGDAQYSVNDSGTGKGATFTGASGSNDQWNFIAITVNSDGNITCRTNGTSYSPTYNTGSTVEKFSGVAWNVVTIGSFDRGSS
ncbi:LamG domain-containing protein, partial [bacterium]|nr:LamG domain-containing protein [bacterium]